MSTFINLRLILEKIDENRYQAKLEHERKTNPKPVEFSFALTDNIRGDKSFHYYFKERLATLKATEEDLEIVGLALYDLVFKEDLGARIQMWDDDLKQGERFRLRLDIQASELISIPWELLRDEKGFLIRRGVSIVRFMNAPKNDINLDYNLKVLIVSSSPNTMSFDEGNYIDPLQSLFNKKGIRPKILRGEQATRQSLQKILDENHYDLFHFVGHGAFEKNKGKVWVRNEQGDKESIMAEDLSVWLWDSGVKFAFFCSCQTGITSEENTFNGVAQSLVGQKIPAVVAMQYNFPQNEAKIFVEAFYDKLLRSESIDEAMRFARNSLPHDEVAWCIPVLYSQFNIGRLFAQSMPNQEEVTTNGEIESSDIEILKDLLERSGMASDPGRENFCNNIGIKIGDLSPENLRGVNDNIFINKLLERLQATGNITALQKLCEKIEPQFRGGLFENKIKIIKHKLS